MRSSGSLRSVVLVDGARSAFARGPRGMLVATRLDAAGASIRIDRLEFDQAFAAQIFPSIRELGIAPERVDVNGGSLGIGHPLGATGARRVTTVAHELRRSGTRYGLATQCIGAGMGISTILEAVR